MARTFLTTITVIIYQPVVIYRRAANVFVIMSSAITYRKLTPKVRSFMTNSLGYFMMSWWFLLRNKYLNHDIFPLDRILGRQNKYFSQSTFLYSNSLNYTKSTCHLCESTGFVSAAVLGVPVGSIPCDVDSTGSGLKAP